MTGTKIAVPLKKL